MDIKEILAGLSEWKLEDEGSHHALLFTVDTSKKTDSGIALFGSLERCSLAIEMLAKKEPNLFMALTGSLLSIAKLNLSDKQMEEIKEFSDRLVQKFLSRL